MINPVTEKLIKAIHKSVTPSPDQDTVEFLKDYYHRISGQDYSDSRVGFLYQAAILHLKLARVRRKQQILIGIKNLTNGDDSERTLVSIVADDRPFLINSLTITLNRLGMGLERTIHPMFQVSRTKKRSIETIRRYRSGDVSTNRSDSVILESFIQFELDPISPSKHNDLIGVIRKVLKNVNEVSSDWQHMRNAVLSLADRIERGHQGPVFAEYGALFRWMAEDNFAFIGYAEIEIDDQGNKSSIDTDSICGILRAAHQDGEDILQILPPIVASETSPVIFTKSRQRLYIHRANFLDCILVDLDFKQGQQSTKTRRRVSCIVGFLAGSTATMQVASIPHIRSKAAFILSESTLRKGGYAYKELRTILETLPRDMILELASPILYGLCMTLLNQQERRKTRLHIQRNICRHFFSCLVYVPRDLFNSRLRQRILELLEDTIKAQEVTFNVYFSDSTLTRIHYTLFTDPELDPGIDQQTLERKVQSMARDWNENLYVNAHTHFNLEQSRHLLETWRDGFPVSYQDRFSTENALEDIKRMDAIGDGEIIPVLDNQVGNQDDSIQQGKILGISDHSKFKLYSKTHSLPLSDVLPILENMGIRVLGDHPYRINRTNGEQFWINIFEIVRQDGGQIDRRLSRVFEDVFKSVWSGQSENDGFNHLTLVTGFNWRQISMIRGYVRYLKQIRLRYSENYVIDVLIRNPNLVSSIGELFDAQFNPSLKSRPIKKTRKRIRALLKEVQTLDEERIIMALLDVFDATLRTNFYQQDESCVDFYLSFKLSSRSIPRIPEPAPKYEIFVYSPRVEGVHLRGGDVARGGLRWSERPEDFRTEVLGLVKAQRVKNAVIVPVGSKGGFVAKKLEANDRASIQNEVIACYKYFISGMLDLTDNIVGNKIVPPKNVVRLDGDDPYLVVAADKGTATFSDIANDISLQRKFWLGDAFASGGSVGYDHKKMGITARGAWESVKRHFRERGKDIQKTEFTVAAIGDMGGDVFGNGMLLSKHIQLIAAFNHLNIFIDPEPDCAKSFKERQRLFDLPRSSWSDYNEKLISHGGGIFDRNAKSIKLSAQARKVLGTNRDTFTPTELINTILKSPVELLWNGGIGTYIKASFESHQDAQDRNNDSLRVDADELRVNVIGEGGNLGMTQHARIEFNQRGGLCYTDAIDNSAGVDTSDHEVNIKILLNDAIQSKTLKSGSRNTLLAKMEQQIGVQVLNNNYIQTQVLSLDTSYGDELMSQQARSISLLEDKGLLNRDLEYLPEDSVLRERQHAGQWFTRAELAVLLSYSKMDLYQDLLKSDVPDSPYLKQEIEAYFPPILVKKFPREIQRHRLKREIICTQITNDLVGKVGSNFHLSMSELMGADASDVTRAYIISRDILDLDLIHQAVRDMDNQIKADIQKQFLRESVLAAESTVVWILRHRPHNLELGAAVKTLQPLVAKLLGALVKMPHQELPGVTTNLELLAKSPGISAATRRKLSLIKASAYSCDIVDLATKTRQSQNLVAEIYFGAAKQLRLDWIRHSIETLPAANNWNQRARFSLGETLRMVHGQITEQILRSTKGSRAYDRIQSWNHTNALTIGTVDQMIDRLKQESIVEFSMLSVVISELTRLVKLSRPDS